MKQVVPIVVFGFDYNKSRTAIGRGTMLRCLKGVEIYKRMKMLCRDAFFIVSPGRAPLVGTEQQPCTMSEMMEYALMGQGIPANDIKIGNPAWGTRDELLEAIRIIANEKTNGLKISQAHLISNKSHLRRIGVLAEALRKKKRLDWEWCYDEVAWETMHTRIKEKTREFCAYVVECFRAPFWNPTI